MPGLDYLIGLQKRKKEKGFQGFPHGALKRNTVSDGVSEIIPQKVNFQHLLAYYWFIFKQTYATHLTS